MSWINPPPENEYPWYLRMFYALQKRRLGWVPEPVLLWGRTPRVFIAFLRLYKAFDRKSSPLEASLRSLLMVRISQINICPFCIDLNSSHALERGIPQEKLEALHGHADSPLFNEREKAALEFAEAMTITGRKVSQALQIRLKANFPDDGIIEMAGLIAYQNMSSKFNSGLDIPAQGFCQLPG
ncbi:MAG: carboxymuconolactone decarboxylase family protein [Candidatus Methylumidiphilus sp.]